MIDPSRSDRSARLATWARRYAQNRNAASLFALLTFAMLFVAIATSAHLAGRAYREGDTLLLAFAGGVMVLAVLANLYVAIPRNSARLFERVNQWLYAGEGHVEIAVPERVSKRSLHWVGLAFAVCVLTSVVFGDRMDPAYRQPLTALYCVPFLTLIILLQRPAASRIALLWPFLYGLHAVLILIGLPIVFAGRWEILNILIPVVGYGLLTQVIQLLYSRVAMSRVKQLSKSGLASDAGVDNGNGSRDRD